MVFSFQILLEIFFPEDNLIRFEMCAIWDVPGKNNNDENKKDATFPVNLFCSSFYQKMEWTKWLQLGKGVSNTSLINLLSFNSISTSA